MKLGGILNILLERECCICEVMQALDISQTRASRNLAALCEAGFLKPRKDGLWSLYSIDRNDMDEYLADFVQAVTKEPPARSVSGNQAVDLVTVGQVAPAAAGSQKLSASGGIALDHGCLGPLLRSKDGGHQPGRPGAHYTNLRLHI